MSIPTDTPHGPTSSVTESDQKFLNRILLEVTEEEAYQHDETMLAGAFNEKNIPLVNVPKELSEKLYAISDTRSRRFFSIQRLGGLAAAALVLVAIFVGVKVPSQPSEQEIRRAQQELAIAFGYLNKVNEKTGSKIQHTVSANLQKASVERVFVINSREKNRYRKKL